MQAVAVSADWPTMGRDFAFAFSLFPMSLVEITRPDGEVRTRYYRQLDISNGKLKTSSHENSSELLPDGPRRLLSFKKIHIDRLGNKREVVREVRIWRGKAYM